MKLTVELKPLTQAISDVAPFSPAKTTIDILKYAKVTTKGNRLKIEANDTHKTMIKYIDVLECDEDGQFLIEIAEVNKFLSKVKSHTVEITAADTEVIIKHAKGEASFATGNVEEYPSFKVNDTETTTLNIPAKAMSEFVKRGKDFVSSDTLRPVLTAIYAYIKDGVFGYCASDTFRLITDHTDAILDTDLDIHWYIDPTIFGALLKQCAVTEGDIAVKVYEGHVSYKMGDTIIHTTQIQGRYPNIERVIPKDWGIECAVDRDELLDSVGRSAMFCGASNCMKLNISPMDIVVSVDNLDYMRKTTETVTHSGCNGEIAIGMRADNLQACLSACDGGEVLMRMTDASRPVIFFQQGCPNRVIMTMPMILAQ